MKKLRNTIACGVAALALLATGLTSCTGDFDNINTSKDKPTPEDVDRDNAWAAFIQTMQRNVFAEGANAYQLADNLLLYRIFRAGAGLGQRQQLDLLRLSHGQMEGRTLQAGLQ